jgi:hypothetical protein
VTIVRDMKLSQKQLRKLVESVVLQEEVDPMIGDILMAARDLDSYINQIYEDMESSESGADVGQKTVNALEHMQKIVDNLIRHYSLLDKNARRPPSTAGKGHFLGSRWVPEE